MIDKIEPEINDNDQTENGRLIAEGNTSGILDREIENKNGKVIGSQRISWKLDAKVWVE